MYYSLILIWFLCWSPGWFLFWSSVRFLCISPYGSNVGPLDSSYVGPMMVPCWFLLLVLCMVPMFIPVWFLWWSLDGSYVGPQYGSCICLSLDGSYIGPLDGSYAGLLYCSYLSRLSDSSTVYSFYFRCPFGSYVFPRMVPMLVP